MASQRSLAIRCDEACRRIETAIAARLGEVDSLPRMHRNREQLRAEQLEQIAAWVEAMPKPRKARKR